jgi:hypothetical protein
MQSQDSGTFSDLDRLARVFPIVDVASAQLMKVKARCVFGAGAITAAELAEVDRRANEAIGLARDAEEEADRAA